MHYLSKTKTDHWILEEAVKEKLSNKCSSIESALNSIRSDLDFYDNPTATAWKSNWKSIAKSYAKKFRTISSEPKSTPQNAFNTINNNGTITNSTFSGNIVTSLDSPLQPQSKQQQDVVNVDKSLSTSNSLKKRPHEVEDLNTSTIKKRTYLDSNNKTDNTNNDPDNEDNNSTDVTHYDINLSDGGCKPDNVPDEESISTDFTYSNISISDSDDQAVVKHKYEYLVGPGEMYISDDMMEDPLFCAWKMNDNTNLSTIFIEHRNRVLKKAEQNQSLTISEQMTLNFIFLINKDRPTPTFLTRNEWKNVVCTMNDIFPLNDLPTSTRNMLYKFSKAAKEDMTSALNILRNESFDEPSTTSTTMITKLLNNIAQKYDGLNFEGLNEDTFINSRVDPIISAFFKNEGDIIIDGCSTTLTSSSRSRKKFDPSLRGKIPDLTISIRGEKTINNIIMMEVKAPNASVEDIDLLKLANLMKDSIDLMHKNGLSFIGGRVFGVLVEGYKCELFVMDLDYTFMYRLFKFGTFYIPRNRYDFGCLTDLIENMLALRQLFDDIINKCHDEAVVLSRLGSVTPPQSMSRTKPSFLSPLHLP